MPSGFQEWLALGVVALTAGYWAGRWWTKRNPSSSCDDCPSHESKPQQFKNIPINVAQKTQRPDK